MTFEQWWITNYSGELGLPEIEAAIKEVAEDAWYSGIREQGADRSLLQRPQDGIVTVNPLIQKSSQDEVDDEQDVWAQSPPPRKLSDLDILMMSLEKPSQTPENRP